MLNFKLQLIEKPKVNRVIIPTCSTKTNFHRFLVCTVTYYMHFNP